MLQLPDHINDVSHLLLHGVVVQEGSQVHRDVAYDAVVQTGLANAHAEGGQGV